MTAVTAEGVGATEIGGDAGVANVIDGGAADGIDGGATEGIAGGAAKSVVMVDEGAAEAAC